MPELMTSSQFIERTTTYGRFGVRGRWAIGKIDNALMRWQNNQRAWQQPARMRHLLYMIDCCKKWLHKKEGKLARADTASNVAKRARVVGEVQQQATLLLAHEKVAAVKITEAYRRIAEKKARWSNQPYSDLRELGGLYKKEREDFETLNRQRLQAKTTQQRRQLPKKDPVALTAMSQTMVFAGDNQEAYKLSLKFKSATATPDDYQTMRALLEDQGASHRCLYMTKAERASHMLIGQDSSGGVLFYKDSSFQPYSCGRDAAYALDQWGCLFAFNHSESGVLADLDGRFINHSSFNKGRGVICAGMIEVQMGQIVYINNSSGHYKPTYRNLHNAVQVLGESGVNLDRITVQVMHRRPNHAYEVNASDFAADINAGYVEV